MILLLLLSCAQAPDKEGSAACCSTATPDTAAPEPATDSGDPPPEAVIEIVALPAPRLLRRMSLDIRGQLPSTDELDAVEADPGALPDIRAEYLSSEAFTERFIHLLNERWQTQVDSFTAREVEFGFEISEEFSFERSVGDEPLRLMAWVATHDRPWSEIVTADYTVANHYLAQAYPLAAEVDGTSWAQAYYTDGRPTAGVLSTNGLWWRYYTTVSNMNRARVAAVSDLLLCNDFLSRPVAFSGVDGLTDDDGIGEAIRTDPHCIACHAAIDPLATTMFGFWWNPLESAVEMAQYHAEREPLGEAWLGVAPAYFGVPVDGLTDVGTLIAADPRFRRCTVETMAGLYWRRPTTLSDFSTIQGLEDRFAENELRMFSLIGDVMDTTAYRAGSLTDEATEETRSRERITRMLSPDQLGSSIAQVSGFKWTWRGFDQLANDQMGFRILGGGVNGVEVFTPQTDASLTWALVVWRMAQFGADSAVQADLVGEEPPTLFQHVDLETTPEEEAFQDELRHLHWALFAVRADPDWMEATTELWIEIEARSGSEAAWTMVLTTMFADPEYVTY